MSGVDFRPAANAAAVPEFRRPPVACYPDAGVLHRVETGLLESLGLPLLRTSKSLILVGPAPVERHQRTIGDRTLPGLPRYGLWLFRVKCLRPCPSLVLHESKKANCSIRSCTWAHEYC